MHRILMAPTEMGLDRRKASMSKCIDINRKDTAAPVDRCALSIVVATHQRACQLERMLASVEQQTLDPGEVTLIVVENGAKDNTEEILARKSARLHIVYLWESVASKAKAMNRALEHVSGDLVVF